MMKFRKPHLVPLAFTLFAIALCAGLGVWQLQRLQQKQALLNQVEAAQSQPALAALPNDASAAYRPVVLTGRYVQGGTLRFIGRQSDGYMLYTPLQIDDSDEVVLVARGFAHRSASIAEPEGVQTVQGFARPLRPKRWFSPANQPDKNVWLVEDLNALQTATGMTLAPYIIEVEKLPPLRNDHLGYALTWFMLAVAATVMFGIYQRER